MKCIYILVSLGLLFFYVSAEAQPRKDKVCIYGNYPGQMDSLVVTWTNDEVTETKNPWPNRKTILPKQSNHFYVQLDSIVQPIRVNFYFYGDGPYLGLRQIMEMGDSIELSLLIRNKGMLASYKGENSAKNKIYSELRTIWRGFTKNELKHVHLDSAAIPNSISSSFNLFDRGYSIMLDSINKYQHQMSKEARILLESEFLLQYFATWELQITRFLSSVRSPLLKEQIKTSFYQSRPPLNLDDITTKLRSKSIILYLLERHKNDLLIKSKGNGYTFRSLYDTISSSYENPILERLFLLLFNDARNSIGIVKYSQDDYDHCLRSAIALVESQKIISNFKQKLLFSKGTPVFDFMLSDTKGTMVVKKDFKGKVVLLDFWSTGCSGCAYFSRIFHQQIAPKIQDKDFILVTINADDKKERWRNSLQTGLYTRKEDIHLYTDGLGMNHPLIKTYQLEGLPFLLLMDRNGNINALPSFSLAPAELLSLIQSALAEVSDFSKFKE